MRDPIPSRFVPNKRQRDLTSSGVRQCWELEEPKGPKGSTFARRAGARVQRGVPGGRHRPVAMPHSQTESLHPLHVPCVQRPPYSRRVVSPRKRDTKTGTFREKRRSGPAAAGNFPAAFPVKIFFQWKNILTGKCSARYEW